MGVSWVIGSFRAAAFGLIFLGCSTVLGIDEDYRVTEGPRVPVEQCKEFADEMCAFRAGCCQTLYPAQWDGPGCVSKYLSACNQASEEVPAPNTYHPEMWAECREALKAATPCMVTYEELIDVVSSIAACFKIITGPVPPGGPCAEQTDCAFVPSPAKAALCQNGTCVLRGKLAPGDPCSGLGLACGPELFCAAGTCQPATSLGQKCQIHPECGPGNRCEPGQLVCAPGIPVGEACADSLECASSGCFEGKCVRLPVFSPAACQGAESF